MNKVGKKVLYGFVIVIGLIILLYFLLAIYFQDKFLCGTYINNRYCTGMTVKQVNELLKADYGKDYIELQDSSNIRYSVPFSEIDGRVDFSKELTKLYYEQNNYLWIFRLFSPSESNFAPRIMYNEEKLEAALAKCSIYDKQNEKELDVFIVETENGYELLDNRKNFLNPQKVFEATKENLDKGESVTIVKDLECYEDLDYTQDMLDTMALFEKVDAYQNSCKVVYDMGDEQIPVDASVVCHFIKLNTDNSFVLDEEGQLVFDPDGVTEFVNELAAQYDTYGTKRKFVTTQGNEIELSGGTYGTTLNQKAEIKYLTKAFLDKTEEVHIPTYTRTSSIRGKDDIGTTYIEIDMTNQIMYYYEKGTLKLETSVVTGNLAKKHDTPEGINYVYAKQKNRILRGPGYASFVYYWMPVKGGIGIHDATWRDEFGGEIYKTSGSHGCINTPLDKMEELYDMVSVGTPVVMYY